MTAKLPPLPEPTEFDNGPNFCCPVVWAYTEEQLVAYAEEAARVAVGEFHKEISAIIREMNMCARIGGVVLNDAASGHALESWADRLDAALNSEAAQG